MRRTLNYEKVFTLLSDSAAEHGMDLVVKDPVDFVKRSFHLSDHATWHTLKALEQRKLIAFNYDGRRIASARLLKRKLPEHFHEQDAMTRVLTALYKHRCASLSDPKKQIVHSSFFGDILGEADVSPFMLYKSFQRFSDNGWIKLIYSGVTRAPRLVYIIIKDEFPTHLVQ